MSYMISKIVILENPTFLLIMQGLYMSLLTMIRVIAQDKIICQSNIHLIARHMSTINLY